MKNEIAKVSPFEITTFEQAERYAKMIAESDFAPKDYRGKPGNVLIAMQMGHELGLKPNQAIQNIAVVNGRPMVWGDAALALVIGNPECGGVREWMEGTIKGCDAICYCEVKRGKEITVREFSVKQAAQAQLLGKAVWAAYPERMLQMRARGYALRDAFPDVLKGIYIEGELIEEDEYKIVEQKEQPKLGIQSVKKIIIEQNKFEEIPSTSQSNNDVSQEEFFNLNTGEVIAKVNAAPSFNDVKNQMENANSVEDLIIVADIARTLGLPKEQRDELSKIYRKKQIEVKG